MPGEQKVRGRIKGEASKYAYLLDDQDIKRWYQNVARGSQITADVYLRRLGNFNNELKLSPKELLKMDDKELSDLLMDFVGEREGKRSPTYISGTLRAVKSWLNFMDKPVRRRIKVHGLNSRPTVENEKVPTQDELKRIVLAATLRDRVCVILMAHSGVRPQVLGSYMGDSGLRLGDLPDLKIGPSTAEFEKTPALVRVPASLSKAGFQYITFLSEEGCDYLREYFESRMRDGEKLTKDSPLVTAKTAVKPFIASTNISDAVRKPIRAAGFQWRPYVLRGYFDTQLLLAESKGLVAHDYRVFWMGHTGSMEARYTTNKNRLPADMIEDMREAYKRCEKYLGTRIMASAESDTKTYLRSELLSAVGYSQEALDNLDISSMPEEEFQKMLRDKVMGNMTNNGLKQKVVQVDEVGRFIEQGYEFYAALPNGTAILKLP